MRLPVWAVALVLLMLARGGAAGTAARPGAPRDRAWFVGDFESGTLAGWKADVAGPGSARVVRTPARGGQHALCIRLAPGDRALDKERAELRLADRTLERRHGGQGREIWYGWSMLVPRDFAAAPDGFHIVGQWHHRPHRDSPSAPLRWVRGAPPLTLHLSGSSGATMLVLVAHAAPRPPAVTLATRAIDRGVWHDLILHVRWSTQSDSFVEAWLDGTPFTAGRVRRATLFTPVSTYLRLGLYRHKHGSTTNVLYYDEVRLGDSYAAVRPRGVARGLLARFSQGGLPCASSTSSHW